VQAIRPDTTAGEAVEVPVYERHRGPGTTADVAFWTTKPVHDTRRSHVNYLVADTRRWEQQAAHYFDTNPKVTAWVKNAGLGFAIRYVHNGQQHEYYPDFLARLAGEGERYVILETKGEHADVVDVKKQAAERWCAAVNTDGQFGEWRYAIAWRPEDIPFLLEPVSVSID
jgi:type III restriction enzyme